MVKLTKDASDVNFDLDKLNVVLFVSRNKDNKTLKRLKREKYHLLQLRVLKKLSPSFKFLLMTVKLVSFRGCMSLLILDLIQKPLRLCSTRCWIKSLIYLHYLRK